VTSGQNGLSAVLPQPVSSEFAMLRAKTKCAPKPTAFLEFQKAYILDPEQPNIRKEYAQALVDSWPRLNISREGPSVKYL
jgi:hypothetical protein